MTFVSRAVSRGLTAVSAFAVLLLVGAPIAHAAPTALPPFKLTFLETETTVAYGEAWTLTAVMEEKRVCRGSDEYNRCPDSVTFTDDSTGESAKSTPIRTHATMYSGVFGTLDAGTHEFSATFKRFKYSAASENTAVVTVTPAQLAIDLRVDSDPDHRRGAVVNAQLTGDYIDRVSCYECVPLTSPAGTWTFEITNADGEKVREEKVETEAIDSQFASFYWDDIPASADFEVSANFVPAGAMEKNFEVAGDSGIQFTSPAAPQSDEENAPAAPVVEKDAAAGEASVPLWALLLCGAILLLLLIAAVVLLNARPRRPRDSRTISPEGSLA